MRQQAAAFSYNQRVKLSPRAMMRLLVSTGLLALIVVVT